jgi:uncharacterized protein YacL
MVGIRKIQKGVVGVLDDGTLLVVDEETERRLRTEGVKVIRVGKITVS